MLKLYNCLVVLCISTCILANNNTSLLNSYAASPNEISKNFNPFEVNKLLNISALSVNTASSYAGRSITLRTEDEAAWRTPPDVNDAPDGVGSNVFAFFAGVETQNLWTKDYGFDLPCNAVIDSVTVKFIRRSEATEVVDINVSLYLPNLQPSALNLADNTTPWLISTSSWETVSYTHENWGETLTPEIINDRNFGVLYAIRNNDATAQGIVALDAVEISVCYTLDTPYANPISYTVVKTDACEGNGSITINANGGSGDYEYSIDEGATWQTNSTFTGLDAGDYKLMVRGTDGSCTTRVVFCALGADERLLQPGDALVTCAPGGGSFTTLAIENIQPMYDLYTAGEVGYDISGNVPDHPFEWSISDLGGSVFSVSIDNDYNIYTGASSLFNLPGNATPIISRIDGVSGAVNQIATLPGTKGVAGVEYDTLCNQLYTANLDDGIIYRLNPVDGTILSTFNPLGADDGTPGFAPLGERVLAVTYNYLDGRLYYSMWNSDGDKNGNRNTVRSVAIDPGSCDFLPATDQLEISTPWTNEYGQPDEVIDLNMPVTDIEFSQDGQTMLLAESGYDSSIPAAQPHDARFMRYTGTTSNWSLSTNIPAGNSFLEYEVGEKDNGLNSRGGIDFAAAGMVNNCTVNNEEFIIGTGDALRGTTCFSFGCIYGFQFMPISGGKPTNSVLLDVARDVSSQQKSVYGDMDIVHGCRVPEFCGEYDLALDKNITSSGPYGPGSTVEFTITVTNEGEVDAGNIVVTDDSPAELSFVSMVPNANLTDNGDETFTITDLPMGTNQTIVVTYTIAADFMGTSLRNDAQITVDDGTDIDSDPNTGYDVDEDGDGDNDDDDEDGVSVLLVQVYDLTLSKELTSTGPYSQGSTVEFTITVENEGSLDAANVVVTDDSPADLNYVSMAADANVTDNGDETFTIASLPASGVQEIVVTYTISNTFQGTTLHNDAQITVDDGDDTDSNPDDDYTVDEDFDLDPYDDDEDGVDVPVGQLYDLELTKALTSTGPYSPGSTVEFTITVSNDGSVDANNIVVTDDSPADLTFVSMAADGNLTDNGDETFTIANLPSAGTQDIVVVYMISNSFMGTSIRNDAQITADDGDDVDSDPDDDYNTDEDGDGDPDDDDEDGVDVPIGQVYDLSLTKVISSTGPYGPGDNVEFTINISNDGSLDAAGIVVTDDSPAELIYQSMASDANVTDNGDETFTVASIPAGTDQDIVVTYQISNTFMGNSLTNDAQITTDDGDDIDSDPDTGDDVDEDGDGNPDDDDEDEVDVPIGQVYDLSLTKTITSAGPYAQGSLVEFTINVSNDGTINANNIEVTDSAPADLIYQSMVADVNVTDNGDETFTIASIPAGTDQDIVVTYMISNTFMGTSLTNDAEITADDGDDIDSDPDTGDDVDEDGDGDPDDDDEDEVEVPIGQVYDLSLTKTITSVGPYGPGDNVEFTINVSNDGSIDANNIEVTDSAPADLIFQSMAANLNIIDNAGGVFTITSLPAGGDQDIVVTYMISSTFMGTSLTNDAEITADDGDDIDSDPDTGDDVDEDGDGDPDDDDEDKADVPIGQVYDLSLTKEITSTGPYMPGSTIEFTINVSNDGSIDANNIEVTDSAPADLIYQSMTADANVIDNGGGVFTVTSIPAGTNQDIVVSYMISSTFMGSSLSNDAEITADDGDDIDSDPDTGDDVDEDGDGDPDDDDEDKVDIPIGQVYDLSLTKTITSAGPYMPGSTIEFTINVSNDGTIDANNIEVTDAAPADLIYQGMTPDGNVVDNGGGVFTVTSIPAGTNQDIIVSYMISNTFMGNSLSNNAEITADDGDDIDSDPDTGDDVDEDGDGDPDDDDEDKVDIPIGQVYDLSLTKAVTSAGPYGQGSLVEFTISVSNDGSLDANNIEVTDSAPADLIYQGMTADANVSDNGGGVFTVTNIPVGGSQDIVVSYMISNTFMGTSLTNDAEITADDGDDIDSDPDTGNDVDEDGDGDPDDDDEDDAEINIGQVYDLSLTKTLTSTGPFMPGSNLTFDIVVSNDGTIDANGIEVTDSPSSGLTYVSMVPDMNITDNGGGVFTIASIPAGTTETIQLTYQIATDYMGGSIGNKAQITKDDGDDIDSDPDTGDDVDEDGDGDPDDDDEDGLDIPVGQVYDLSLTKALTSNGPYSQGSILTFDITVSNDGTIDANNIEVTDSPSAGLSYVSMEPNGNIVDNGGGVFTITSIPAGTTEVIELTYQIDDDFMGGNLGNDAQITADDGDDIDSDPDTGNDVDEDGDGDPDDDDEDGLDIPVDQVYDLSLTKALTSTGPYMAGSSLTFDIVVSNDGSIDANNIEVTDTPSAGMTYVSMVSNGNITDNGGGVFTITSIPAGTTEVIELTYQIDNNFMGGSLRNDAEITADDGDDIDSDPDTGNDVDEDGDGDPDDDDEDGLDIPVNQIYDLSLQKELVSAPPYAPGDTLDFEISVSNDGSIDANNIEVTDTPGAALIYVGSEASMNIVDNGGGVFTILSIPVGQTATIQLSYQLDPNFTGSGAGNKAQITKDDGDDIDSDPDTGDDVDEDGDGDPDDDDEDSVDFPVTIYDLALVVDLTSNGPHLVGGEATFKITVINQGNTDANNVDIVNYIPEGFSLSPNDNNGWNGPINGTTDTYENTIPFIPSGGQATIDIVLSLDETPNGPDAVNWAEISADDGNDVDSTPDTINDDPYGGDNIVDNTDGDEDDHDNADIYVELGLTSLGDRVWNDLNGNGLQDSGEPGIENVIVKLYNGDGFLQDLVATGSDGNYLFDRLNPGVYYIEFDLPAGFDPTIPYLGNNTELDSDIDGSNGPNTTTKITLTPGENNLSIDAGIHECQPLGEYVWFDKNMNNTFDRTTENGINGLIVDLYRNIDGVWVYWDRDWTGIHPNKASEDGYFKFCVPPGEYYIDFDVPPTGMVPVRPGVGDERNDSDLDDGNGEYTTSTFTVVAGEDNCDIGAGFYTMGSIGDIVWLDSNTDGVRSSNEAPMSGVLVEAYDIHNDLVGSAVTDEDGRYMVDYLRQEDYYLKFYPPEGYTLTTPNAIVNDAEDSDVDHSNGENTTGYYEAGPAIHIPNVDAGMVIGVALPVDLTEFDGSYRQDYIYLNWETAAEINTEYFLVERRFHTEDIFNTIARQPAKGSASSYNINDYDVDDSGVYYYRLRSIDRDGSEEVSKVISVDIESERSGDVNVYPNPAIDQINIDINLKNSKQVSIDIYNSTGQLIQAGVINQRFPKGVYNAIVDISDLNAGVYNIMITKDTEVVSKKLIVLKN